MVIKRLRNGKKKYTLKFVKHGGINMENVINLNSYKGENECEWDVISNIFSEAINKKSLSKKQISEIIENVTKEVRK